MVVVASQKTLPDLDAIKRQFTENKDFRIKCTDRGSRATIVSPHGGFIEQGTSAIAAAIAAKSYNLFDFQALDSVLAQRLHVTSTKFRDPSLMRLLKVSEIAISIHGMGTRFEKTIWLGGLNGELKALVHRALESEGFTVNPNSPLYKGESRTNFVNLATKQGVQLELSNELLAELFDGPAFFVRQADGPKTTERFQALVRAIRKALRLYWQLPAPVIQALPVRGLR